ncbi:MAG: hypothetical protein Q8O43_10815 [Dehalococcoidia bacterium]|nr:hypothetical protein [Dehalococcoidia bacterium]
MSTATEYERPKTGIIDFNLSITEEASPGVRSGSSPGGFLAECYLGPGDSRNSEPHDNWHIHYRD